MVLSRANFALVGLAVVFLSAPARAQQSVPVPDHADLVVVDKSERKLYLLKAGRVLREFDVSLGLVPSGPKQREGDFKTPEGTSSMPAMPIATTSSRSTSRIPTNPTGRARARRESIPAAKS
jgi:L,D-transpeptidase catalytic domain